MPSRARANSGARARRVSYGTPLYSYPTGHPHTVISAPSASENTTVISQTFDEEESGEPGPSFHPALPTAHTSWSSGIRSYEGKGKANEYLSNSFESVLAEAGNSTVWSGSASYQSSTKSSGASKGPLDFSKMGNQFGGDAVIEMPSEIHISDTEGEYPTSFSPEHSEPPAVIDTGEILQPFHASHHVPIAGINTLRKSQKIILCCLASLLLGILGLAIAGCSRLAHMAAFSSAKHVNFAAAISISLLSFVAMKVAAHTNIEAFLMAITVLVVGMFFRTLLDD